MSLIYICGCFCIGLVIGIILHFFVCVIRSDEKPIGSIVVAADEDGDYLFLQLDSQESMIDIRTKPTVTLRVENRSFNEK